MSFLHSVPYAWTLFPDSAISLSHSDYVQGSVQGCFCRSVGQRCPAMVLQMPEGSPARGGDQDGCWHTFKHVGEFYQCPWWSPGCKGWKKQSRPLSSYCRTARSLSPVLTEWVGSGEKHKEVRVALGSPIIRASPKTGEASEQPWNEGLCVGAAWREAPSSLGEVFAAVSGNVTLAVPYSLGNFISPEFTQLELLLHQKIF